MNILAKLKETSMSVIPVMLIVFVLNLTIAPIGWTMVARFAAGGALVILGLSLFLLGTDISVVPTGQRVGAALMNKRRASILLAVGFAVGFLVTAAEPVVRVLVGQVGAMDASLNQTGLILAIALGVGIFVALGFARIVFRVPYRVLIVVFYSLVIIAAFLTDPAYLGLGFDSGGAATGPLTVPFVIALGVGVAAVRKNAEAEDDSFGMVGLASIGPILIVLLIGVFSRGSMGAAAAESAPTAVETGVLTVFARLLPRSAFDVAIALGPLAVMFAAFQLFLIRLPRRQLLRVAIGLAYTYVGLVAFFMGVNGGFMPAGALVGQMIGSLSWNWVLVPIGALLGALIVLAEPAIWVLNAQVEEVSGGHIRRSTMLISLSVGVAFAVALAMLRIVTGISVKWILIPGYAIALALSFASPKLFTAIAFDSGAVASGPMSSTFLLALALGASGASGGDPIADGFGVIAIIAMIPLIAIQVLGVLYRIQERRAQSETGGAS